MALSANDEMVHRRSQDAHVVLTEISSLAMVHASTFTVSNKPALAESTVSFPLLSDGAKEGNLLGVSTFRVLQFCMSVWLAEVEGRANENLQLLDWEDSAIETTLELELELQLWRGRSKREQCEPRDTGRLIATTASVLDP